MVFIWSNRHPSYCIPLYISPPRPRTSILFFILLCFFFAEKRYTAYRHGWSWHSFDSLVHKFLVASQFRHRRCISRRPIYFFFCQRYYTVFRFVCRNIKPYCFLLLIVLFISLGWEKQLDYLISTFLCVQNRQRREIMDICIHFFFVLFKHKTGLFDLFLLYCKNYHINGGHERNQFGLREFSKWDERKKDM